MEVTFFDQMPIQIISASNARFKALPCLLSILQTGESVGHATRSDHQYRVRSALATHAGLAQYVAVGRQLQGNRAMP